MFPNSHYYLKTQAIISCMCSCFHLTKCLVSARSFFVNGCTSWKTQTKFLTFVMLILWREWDRWQHFFAVNSLQCYIGCMFKCSSSMRKLEQARGPAMLPGLPLLWGQQSPECSSETQDFWFRTRLQLSDQFFVPGYCILRDEDKVLGEQKCNKKVYVSKFQASYSILISQTSAKYVQNK